MFCILTTNHSDETKFTKSSPAPALHHHGNATYHLTHWGWVTHICVSKLTIIGSENGLSPGRCQAIVWTNDGILLIGPLGTNFSEILVGIQTFPFKKMQLKMSSAECRPFCLGLNVLKRTQWDKHHMLSYNLVIIDSGKIPTFIYHPPHPTPNTMAAILVNDIFKSIFLNENYRIPIQISLKFVPRSAIDNKPALVEVMVWRRWGDKPLPETMLTQFIDAYICGTKLGGDELKTRNSVWKWYLGFRQPTRVNQLTASWRHQMETFSA